MKRILINGRFSSHHFAIRNVIFNIAKELSMKGDWDVYIVLNKDSEIQDFQNLNLKIITNPCPADSAAVNHLYTIFILPWILLFRRISLVIYPQISVFLFNPCKTVMYMHDLIEYHIDSQKQSKLAFRKIVYPYVCKHSDMVVAVSESTKKDIIDILKIPESKVVVAYDGKDENLIPIEKVEARSYIKKKYGVENFVFYIGYLTHPQKNLIYLIDEFTKLSEEKSQVSLVFAGPRGKDADYILDHGKKSLGDNHFTYLGKVPYEDLKYLYSACEIFCFPSLFEGFGMPVLEAMSCGAVVISSNVSSIPEILRDSRFLVDPQKDGELSKRLIELYGKDNQAISESNITTSKNFSWEKHGDILSVVINNLINNK